jgi:hypothetical protein
LTPKAAQIDVDTVLAATSPAGLAFVATKSDPRPYVPAEFHLIMAQAMVDLEQHRLDALFMSVPVRHGKTRLGSNIMPAWFLGLHPDREILAASHAAEFAADKVGGPARDFFVRTSKRYFGVTIDPLANARGRWKTSGGGGMRAVGVQQGIAGQGADLAIVDDPYANVEDAMNRRQRDKAWEWYQAEFVTRCSPGAPHIHIMSRWNVDDHMARALEQAKEAKLRFRRVLVICRNLSQQRDRLGRYPYAASSLWPTVWRIRVGDVLATLTFDGHNVKLVIKEMLAKRKGNGNEYSLATRQPNSPAKPRSFSNPTKLICVSSVR